MEKEGKKKLKYVTPTSLMMEFTPGCILAGSAGPGGWSVDDGSTSTGATSGGWSVDDGGSTGASTGGWSSDGGGGTGASTGGWTTN